ncbi:MAG TPA: nuclear transport factor 2 family protein [Pyrinomonadaceae bacterium]|nr:nuclear transport factor 2 family protein [Pyrinomonadaceae bacterium]
MSTASTPLPDTTEPVATVRHYIESFNKGDAKAMAAMCAVPMSILDGMAPHVWHGPAAAEDWYRDAMTEGEHLGATDYSVTLGEPRHNDITGHSAYVVFPTTMTFKLHGKQITQTGAFFTVALRKLNDGWRIASWAWTKGTAQPSA